MNKNRSCSRHELGPETSLHLEALEARCLLAADVYITELMARNETTLRDGFGEFSDWIELFNAGGEPVDLAGWHLTDNPDEPTKWTFPQQELAPQEYLIVFASGQQQNNVMDEDGHWHTNFRLSGDGEYLALIAPDGQVQQAISPGFPAQFDDVSYGFAQQAEAATFVGSASEAEYLIPDSQTNLPDWRNVEFEPLGWQTAATMPIGFDRSPPSTENRLHWNFDGFTDFSFIAVDSTNQIAAAVIDNVDSGADSFQVDKGPAAEFSGNGYLEVPENRVSSSENFTLGLWFQPLESGRRQTLVSQRIASRPVGFELSLDETDRITLRTGDGQQWHEFAGPTLQTNAWHHLAVTLDHTAQSMALYLDGRPVVQAEYTYTPSVNRPLLLGANTGLSNNEVADFLHGRLDNVSLFARALSTAEIQHVISGNVDSIPAGPLNGQIQSDVGMAMSGQTASALLRIPFTVESLNGLRSLTLEAQADDGVVAFLNGQPVLFDNAAVASADALAWNSTAASSRSSDQLAEFQQFDISSAISQLRPGDNILALQGLNVSADDTVFFLDVRLHGEYVRVEADRGLFLDAPTPASENTAGQPNVTTAAVLIDQPSQSFATSLTVQIMPANENELPAGSEIRYSLDGSEPNVDSPRYTEPLQIMATAQLRARVFAPNSLPGPIATAQYLRIGTDMTDFASGLPILVIDNHGQGAVPNAGWNQTNAGIRQVARQANSFTIFEPHDGATSLTQAPSLSVRTGMRVRGAFSSSFSEPGYSVEGWSESRDVDTSFAPLGLAPAADWILYSPNFAYDQALMDNTFMFSLSQAMGRWAPEFRYVELFLNTDGDDITMADYAGLYVIVEKVERTEDRIEFDSFATDGTSGGWLLEINRMDSISEDGQPPRNFHTAGPNGVLQTPHDLSAGSGQGDDIPRQYNAYINYDDPNGQEINQTQVDAIDAWFAEMEAVLYGRNPDVTWNDPVEGYAKYIDVDSFIDYLIMNNLSKNGDGLLISLWIYNPDPNHDGKLTMGPIWDVDLGSFEGSATAELMRRTDRLWYGRMIRDPDFVQRYTDRWFELRQGPLADENMQAILDGLVAQIDEQAVRRDGLTNWSGRVRTMTSWILRRAEAIDDSLTQQPALSTSQRNVEPGTQVMFVSELDGYYTLDGSDPRAAGGEPAASAIAFKPGDMISINADMHVVARSFANRRWSAPVNFDFRTFVLANGGDLNRDDQLDDADLRIMCLALQTNDLRLDLNRDMVVDQSDVDQLIHTEIGTTYGDANLDGRFETSDLVLIFTAGLYEVDAPASWSAGDFNCDGRFTSADLVLAFADFQPRVVSFASPKAMNL
ncbi:MAG: CotH kinase family protein [Pirellulaceae bacterium]